jgi:hypothetical protein
MEEWPSAYERPQAPAWYEAGKSTQEPLPAPAGLFRKYSSLVFPHGLIAVLQAASEKQNGATLSGAAHL